MVDCSSLTIFDTSIVLQPYVFVVISIVCNSIFNIVCNFCVKKLAEFGCISSEDVAISLAQMSLKSNRFKLYLDIVILVMNFGHSISKVVSLDINSFHKFFLLYAFLFNTGVISTFSSYVYPLFFEKYIKITLEEFGDTTKFYKQVVDTKTVELWYIKLFLLLFLPINVFSCSAFFIFMPVMIGAVLCIAIASCIITYPPIWYGKRIIAKYEFEHPTKHYSEDADMVRKIQTIIDYSIIAGRFTISCTMVLAIQTMSNYAVLFFTGMRWDEVIVTEYNLRNISCYISNIEQGYENVLRIISQIF